MFGLFYGRFLHIHIRYYIIPSKISILIKNKNQNRIHKGICVCKPLSIITI